MNDWRRDSRRGVARLGRTTRGAWLPGGHGGRQRCTLGAVRSRRERLRTWASLTAVRRFAENAGLEGFSVEL